jgi:hypothetical protein
MAAAAASVPHTNATRRNQCLDRSTIRMLHENVNRPP